MEMSSAKKIKKQNSKNKKLMSSRSKSRKTIGPCSSSAQVSTFRRFPMSPLEQKEGRCVWVMEGPGDLCGVCAHTDMCDIRGIYKAQGVDGMD